MTPEARSDDFGTLPALKGLGSLSELRPVVVIDTREQLPLPISRLPWIRSGLTSGDYSVLGLEHLFAVERKSIPDLVACCCSSERDRFERELERLRGYQFSRLLIVGSREDIENHNYRSSAKPKAVLHSLASFEARYIPVVFSPDPRAAAEQVERWAYWFSRSVVEGANDLLRARRRLEKEGIAVNG